MHERGLKVGWTESMLAGLAKPTQEALFTSPLVALHSQDGHLPIFTAGSPYRRLKRPCVPCLPLALEGVYGRVSLLGYWALGGGARTHAGRHAGAHAPTGEAPQKSGIGRTNQKIGRVLPEIGQHAGEHLIKSGIKNFFEK